MELNINASIQQTHPQRLNPTKYDISQVMLMLNCQNSKISQKMHYCLSTHRLRAKLAALADENKSHKVLLLIDHQISEKKSSTINILQDPLNQTGALETRRFIGKGCLINFRTYQFQDTTQDMTLKFFTSNPSYLQLTKLGLQKLQQGAVGRPHKGWFYGRLKDTSVLKGQLRQEYQNLQKKLALSGKETTDHHIFPGNYISRMLVNALNSKQGVSSLTKYLNSRKGVYNLIHYNVHGLQEPDEDNTILDIYSSIFWLDYNLILGPESRLRADDPAEKIDDPLRQQQSDTNKIFYEKIQGYYNNGNYVLALNNFLEPKTLNNVVWDTVVDQTTGSIKYKAGSKTDEKANAGYAYDLWSKDNGL